MPRSDPTWDFDFPILRAGARLRPQSGQIFRRVEGIVEVFDLQGHSKATRAYAWAHDTNDPVKPKRHVAVLHIHPVTSAEAAVRAAIVQEFRNLGTAEEE